MVVESTLDTGVHGMPFSAIEKVICNKTFITYKGSKSLESIFLILSEEIVL